MVDAETARLVSTVGSLFIQSVLVLPFLAAIYRKLDTKIDRKDYDDDQRVLNIRIASKQDRAA